MESIVSFFTKSGFHRTNTPLAFPIVVHAVAGAGKSFTIRRLLEEYPDARAYTHGIPDAPNLSSRFIRPYRKGIPEAPICVLDEYNAKPFSGPFNVLISDNLQHDGESLQPHFTLNQSFRLGRATCELLRALGYDIFSRREHKDSVVFGPLFSSTLHGSVVCPDPAVFNLVKQQLPSAQTAREVVGQEFDVVTVVVSQPLELLRCKHDLYVALTRHRRDLHVVGCSHPNRSS